jgi:serine/threonine-protein kinase
MLLAPGTMISPELRLTAPLGAGAMGTIWGGEHLRLKRPVAIKFISPELLATNPQARERFDREAQVLTGYRHPNVVELIESGSTAGGMPYIVLELMQGEVLIERLERDGVFQLEDVGRVVDQLARSIASMRAASSIATSRRRTSSFAAAGTPLR